MGDLIHFRVRPEDRAGNRNLSGRVRRVEDPHVYLVEAESGGIYLVALRTNGHYETGARSAPLQVPTNEEAKKPRVSQTRK